MSNNAVRNALVTLTVGDINTLRDIAANSSLSDRDRATTRAIAGKLEAIVRAVAGTWSTPQNDGTVVFSAAAMRLVRSRYAALLPPKP